ncbi:hypothetical protein [Paraferrimonas haliotis]|uniref:Uncharacterized protein n=1 Tax=Paraferrimonas haliotis TaxID=2013866 RepID=A0AA37WYJ6_9GAMM|nr:hypothetical protein [Paraferrimonas haliotis]GLS83256.1 hypothetical protein GCM10007894_12330 [Paraferrimonas haliotis]
MSKSQLQPGAMYGFWYDFKSARCRIFINFLSLGLSQQFRDDAIKDGQNPSEIFVICEEAMRARSLNGEGKS